MIRRVAAIAAIEFRIARRNHWVLTAAVLMLLFALALTFAGSAPTGTLGVDLLTASVASMTTLSVYLTPLLALLLSFDAISGERERGSLALLLSYRLTRSEILAGKLLAHLAVLTFAMTTGFGAAGVAAITAGGAGPESLAALVRLIGSSVILGATFLAFGYAVSSLAGSTTASAGLAVGIWMVTVVLYDLGLLGAVVMDDAGFFTQNLFPWLLTLNPADALRLWNVAESGQLALASGLTGAVNALPKGAPLVSLLIWPLLALGFARLAIRKTVP